VRAGRSRPRCRRRKRGPPSRRPRLPGLQARRPHTPRPPPPSRTPVMDTRVITSREVVAPARPHPGVWSSGGLVYQVAHDTALVRHTDCTAEVSHAAASAMQRHFCGGAPQAAQARSRACSRANRTSPASCARSTRRRRPWRRPRARRRARARARARVRAPCWASGRRTARPATPSARARTMTTTSARMCSRRAPRRAALARRPRCPAQRP